jgi:hypothetical protein
LRIESAQSEQLSKHATKAGNSWIDWLQVLESYVEMEISDLGLVCSSLEWEKQKHKRAPISNWTIKGLDSLR